MALSGMVKPISLRLHNAEIAKAHATLIRAGRGEELRQIRAAAALRQARATVAQAEERKRLKRIAALAAHKAILAVRVAYQAQDKVADDFEREQWRALRDIVINELERIAQGRRP